MGPRRNARAERSIIDAGAGPSQTPREQREPGAAPSGTDAWWRRQPTWEVWNISGLATSRQPCSGPRSICAHAASGPAADDAGAAAPAPAPAAAGAASLAAAAATSWARKARQSLSAEATGRVSGMRLPLGGCWSSLLPQLPPAAAHTAVHRRCREGERELCAEIGTTLEMVQKRQRWWETGELELPAALRLVVQVQPGWRDCQSRSGPHLHKQSRRRPGLAGAEAHPPRLTRSWATRGGCKHGRMWA